MEMSLHPANIDFILVNYFSEDLAKIAIESIYKFTKSSFNVLLIDNSKDKSLLKNKLKNFNKDNFHLINGYDQETPEERFENGLNGITWYDTEGGKYGPGSLHHNKAFNMGIDLCKSKYICHVDIDSLFLKEWEEDILPLLETNLFVSHGESKGIAREYFLIWEKEKFEQHNLRPDLSYVDTCGNLTKFAKDNNIPFYVCENTAFRKDKIKKHIIKLDAGTQSYTPNGLPYHYHLGRGTSLKVMGQGECKSDYINLCKIYLEK
tara:strand:- start:1538 stop:2326 length:789 start_codon:yes stop_codon:yes gene_type:complete